MTPPQWLVQKPRLKASRVIGSEWAGDHIIRVRLKGRTFVWWLQKKLSLFLSWKSYLFFHEEGRRHVARGVMESRRQPSLSGWEEPEWGQHCALQRRDRGNSGPADIVGPSHSQPWGPPSLWTSSYEVYKIPPCLNYFESQIPFLPAQSIPTDLVASRSTQSKQPCQGSIQCYRAPRSCSLPPCGQGGLLSRSSMYEVQVCLLSYSKRTKGAWSLHIKEDFGFQHLQSFTFEIIKSTFFSEHHL